jgi:hypothetical protein
MEQTATNTITALHSETATSYLIEPTATLQEVLELIPEAVANRYEIEFNNFHGVDRIYIKLPAWTTFEQGKIEKVYVSEYSVEIYAGKVVFILKRNVTDVQIVLL